MIAYVYFHLTDIYICDGEEQLKTEVEIKVIIITCRLLNAFVHIYRG